ncbi:hypothetical protein TL16_g12918 [Triparma laevis f. inornata]|uniref:Polygalacturonase n=2 Tax=Triparma laevis TaxID=1534972 RepID=A0A9W7A019_9STRA|nr:hypothetical protein TrLO_g13766 [Triparma laevis f. longispina]GMH94487.1 hypothetical protein TL16_g12918 [Triparma laevis f. inornata]
MFFLRNILIAALLAHTCATTVKVKPEEFGAVGDGEADDTVAIANALDSCSLLSNDTECRLVFDNSYLTGPIVLARSKTILEVNGLLAMLPRSAYCKIEDCEAPLHGSFISNDADAIPCQTSSNGYETCMHDITITGTGTISSTDPWAWWPCKYTNCWRPHLIVLYKILNAEISGVTLKDAPNHNIEMDECVTSRLHDFVITAPYISPNTDGVNFYGGFDSLMENVVVDNGDDCVSVVPIGEWEECCIDTQEEDIKCSGGHVVFRNLTCNGGHGLSIGGVRHGNVRNVTFENILATGGQKGSTQDEAAGGGCRVKSYPNSTGVVRDITYDNVEFQGVYLPIQLLGHYCPWPCTTPDGESAVLFTSIKFNNIRGYGKQRSKVVEFKCSEYEHCTDITMQDVSLKARDDAEGLMTCENIDSLEVDADSFPNQCS